MYHLRFFGKCTTETLRKRLVEALLFPHLNYCSVVLLNASQELRIRLQVLQNSGVRYVVGLRRDGHITPHRTSLGWLRTDLRRQYFMAVLMYKIVCMHVPDCLVGLFTRYVPRGNVRGVIKELEPPLMRKSYGFKSFQVRGAHLWNSLPIEIRNLPSLSWFKRVVKRHSDLE